jgi:cytochrome c553
MKNILKWTGIVLGGLVVLSALAIGAMYPSGMKKFARSYPNIQVENVPIPTDSEAVTRGKHVSIIWTCTKCHGENLGGMLLANDPFLGTLPASNLTSGKGGVANSYTDADWVRAIRHGVKRDGRIEIFMYDYFSTMSDRDLGGLIAYLKQIPPVDSDYPALHIGPIVAAAPAVGLFTPAAETIDHNASRPVEAVPGATIEYGRYLSAICLECHSLNLANKLENWTQEDFIRAVQTGVLPNGKQLGTTMSSKTFHEMNDMELSALWLYFTSLKP